MRTQKLASASMFAFACTVAFSGLAQAETQIPSSILDTVTPPPAVFVSPLVVPVQRVMTAPMVIAPATTSLQMTMPVQETVVRTQSMVVPSLTTSTISLTNLTDPAGQAIKRLAAMNDQIRLGAQQGWINPSRQAMLTAEHDRIASLINSSLIGGLSRDEINTIETQLNLLNQRVTNTGTFQ